jgi:plastocyanin
MRNRNAFPWISTLLLASLTILAGCGGGGGETTPAAPATEGPAPAEEAAAPPPAAPAGEPGPTGSSTITGTVKYEGEIPPARPVRMEADPGCAKKHSTPPESEFLVLGEGNTMGNVYVSVTGGLPGGSYPPPAEPAVLDQEGCKYVPHVLGVMQNQKIRVLNSDGLLHNVHALPKKNKEFNTAMPATRTETEVAFSEAEEMFKIKCDVHPWMGAWVQVSSHPFFDVTGEDGSFTLANLPAGSYEVSVWHEKLGTATQSVEVADGGGAELSFTMSR